MSSYADYDVEPEADLAAGDLPNFRVHVHDFDGCVRRLRFTLNRTHRHFFSGVAGTATKRQKRPHTPQSRRRSSLSF